MLLDALHAQVYISMYAERRRIKTYNCIGVLKHEARGIQQGQRLN